MPTNHQPIIGLEVHIELDTKSKMFCSCANDSNERHPNTLICPICLGHPGTLPVINEEAIRKVVKTGLALNCRIPEYSKFDRKNYFYPDLPKGYQISQYDAPLCLDGELLGVKIRRIHLEEDTGRLVHPVRNSQKKKQGPFGGTLEEKNKISNGVHLVRNYQKKKQELFGGTLGEKNKIFNGAYEKDYSLVDFNRAGVPLMELVTEPDIRSAQQARKFAEELQLILRYLGVSDADMEKGQMRVEANISLLRQNQKSKIKNQKLGIKVEIKNLNSFRALEKALDYEVKRQSKLLKDGKKIFQETRGWDDIRGVTISQRIKEEAKDYRYFPEPDLPSLRFTDEIIKQIRVGTLELPQARRERFKKEYGIEAAVVEIFVRNKDLGKYFEKVVSELPPNLSEDALSKLIKLTSNYMITDLQGLLKGISITGEDFLITPENFAEFITLIYEGKISSKIAKQVLNEMFSTGADPSHIIEEKRLVQITDETAIEKIVKEVISKTPQAVEDFKKGKTNVFQYLIGQIMSQTKGKANPQLVNKLLKKSLTRHL